MFLEFHSPNFFWRTMFIDTFNPSASLQIIFIPIFNYSIFIAYIFTNNYSEIRLKINEVTILSISNAALLFCSSSISDRGLHAGWFLAKRSYHRMRAIEDGVSQPVVLSQLGQDKELTKNKIWESYRARPHSINKNAWEKSYIEIREATDATVQLTVLNSKKVSHQNERELNLTPLKSLKCRNIIGLSYLEIASILLLFGTGLTELLIYK